PSPSSAACPRTPGSAAGATRTRALTRPRTGSRSTRNISRSTPARSRTTWPRGGRRPVALLERPDLHVPAAEVRPQRDDASVFSLVVVKDAAPGGKAEARLSAGECHRAPARVDAPGPDEGRPEERRVGQR